MSVVMVLQFGDDISVPGVQRLLHEALRNWPQLPVEMGYVAIDGDAQLVLDVFVPPELGGGRHVAVFSEDGEWVIEHSLVCRRSERMVACPYIKLVFSEVLQLDANGEGRPDAGKWRLEMGKDALDVPCLFMIWEG